MVDELIELDDKTLKKLEQELKKMTKLNEDNERPAIQELHYTEDGHVEMTNAHVAVRLLDVHDDGDSNEDYPDLDFVFRDLDEQKSVEVPVDVLKQVAGMFKSLKQEGAMITFSDEYIAFDVISNDPIYVSEVMIKVNLDIKEEFLIGFNPEYIYNAMMFLGKLGIEKATMKYHDPLRPVKFVHENVEYVVTPIRLSDQYKELGWLEGRDS